MTAADTSRIMNVLNAAFPGFYAKTTGDAERKQILALWAEMFRDDDVALVAAAVKALIATETSGFPPTIGQVKNQMRKLAAPQELTPEEAWGLVAAALKNSAYESAAEFKRLPEQIQRFVGSPSQLRDWALMDSDTVHSVVASNFQRGFRVRQKADRDYAALPEGVKAYAAQVAAKRTLMLDE